MGRQNDLSVSSIDWSSDKGDRDHSLGAAAVRQNRLHRATVVIGADSQSHNRRLSVCAQGTRSSAQGICRKRTGVRKKLAKEPDNLFSWMIDFCAIRYLIVIFTNFHNFHYPAQEPHVFCAT